MGKLTNAVKLEVAVSRLLNTLEPAGLETITTWLETFNGQAEFSLASWQARFEPRVREFANALTESAYPRAAYPERFIVRLAKANARVLDSKSLPAALEPAQAMSSIIDELHFGRFHDGGPEQQLPQDAGLHQRVHHLSHMLDGLLCHEQIMSTLSRLRQYAPKRSIHCVERFLYAALWEGERGFLGRSEELLRDPDVRLLIVPERESREPAIRRLLEKLVGLLDEH